MRSLLPASPARCAVLARATTSRRVRPPACRPAASLKPRLGAATHPTQPPPPRVLRSRCTARPRCDAATSRPLARPERARRLRALKTALRVSEVLLFLGLLAFSAALPPLICLEWWALLSCCEAAAVACAVALPLAFAPAAALRGVAAWRRWSLARDFAAAARKPGGSAVDAALAVRKAAVAALARRAAASSEVALGRARTVTAALATAAAAVAVLRAAAGAAAWTPPLAAAAVAAALLLAPLPPPPLFATDPFASRELRLARALEGEAYATLHRGTHHCAWRPDAYPATAKAGSEAKARTNQLFAAAVEDALRDSNIPPRGAHALVLDAATGVSSAALEHGTGLLRRNIFCPNSATPSAAALRAPRVGVRAFYADVGELLRRRPAHWEAYEAIWLDYCSGVASRAGDLAALFGAHALAPGGVLGLGFSHRDSGAALASREGLRADAHAARMVRREAARRGFAARVVARHDYDGMCFMAFRVELASKQGWVEEADETWGAEAETPQGE